jgi:hypothetical protein
MGSRDSSVGMSQGIPERHVPIADQCNHSAERRRQSMFLSAAKEVAVVDIPSLRCIQLS